MPRQPHPEPTGEAPPPEDLDVTESEQPTKAELPEEAPPTVENPPVTESSSAAEEPPAVEESVTDSEIVPVEPPPVVGRLAAALSRLRAAIGGAAYPLVMPSAEDARRIGAALVSQLDDYLLPRLARLDAPLLVVVGGSTGAGKSTLVNSLVRTPVSAAGVLRPTTRSPVLVSNPGDLAWFRQGQLLPGLVRTPESSPDPAYAADRLRPGTRRRTRLPGRSGHRLGGRPQPRPRRATAGRRRPLVVRHHRGPVRRRRAVGAPDHRPAARHRDRAGPRPRPAGRDRRGHRPPARDAGEPQPGRRTAVRAAGDHAGRPGPDRRGRDRPAARLVRPARGGLHRAHHGGAADPGRRAHRARPGRGRSRRRRRRPGHRGQRAGRAGHQRLPQRPADRGGRPARRPAAARRGARPLAGVRRHRRVHAHPGEQGGPAARPDRLGAHRATAARSQSPGRARVAAGHTAARGGHRRGRAGVHGLAGPPGRRRPARAHPAAGLRRPAPARRPAGPRLAAVGARAGPRAERAKSAWWPAAPRTRSTAPGWP